VRVAHPSALSQQVNDGRNFWAEAILALILGRDVARVLPSFCPTVLLPHGVMMGDSVIEATPRSPHAWASRAVMHAQRFILQKFG
jgi:hypothetical protein